MREENVERLRASTGPRPGYSWQTDAEKKEEIERRIARGSRELWIIKEAKRLGIEIND
jgi:hypothetical protein